MEQGSDPLATLLFQISSPAHIPWGDQRWQEVLHGYDVWVHMDADNPLIEQACQSTTKHAELSSNLAALSLHVTRMLRDLVHDIRTLKSETKKRQQLNGSGEEAQVADFSKRISSVGKARATAGALQLLRLLCHPVIVEASSDSNTSVNTLKEIFTYRTRGDLAADQSAGLPLIHSLLDLMAVLGTKTTTTTTSSSSNESTIDVLRTPEIYDAAVFALKLFFVLCGTQLYQPFYSSFESNYACHYFIDEVFRESSDENDTVNEDEGHNLQLFGSSSRSVGSNSTRSMGNGSHRSKRRSRHRQRRNQSGRPKIWTPKAILETCLGWQLERPQAPERSISLYYYALARAALDAKGGEKPGPDGLYENYMVVQATSPTEDDLSLQNDATENKTGDDGPWKGSGQGKKKNFIIDTTKGILTLSGSIIFLPFRLLNLMYGVITAKNKNGSRDLDKAMAIRKLATAQYSRTRDVLWLSDSLLADLGCSAILFFASNNRNGEKSNNFRKELKDLTDNRWDQGNGGPSLPDLPNFQFVGGGDDSSTNGQNPNPPLSIFQQQQRIMPFGAASSSADSHLMVNFESLFDSFGRTLHNELGALLLYTLMQASPSFAEWIAVRSDMDNIVMPLVRTLYFAFRSNTFMAKDFGRKKGASASTKNKSETSVADIRDCPFRSESQLYVIIILLLLFSQDSYFGRTAFQRVKIASVPWYKERSLKGINLGSVIILTLLRSLIFNLNRLNDVFLLNNCLAVLENLSPSVADLHEYAAMRLVSVTVLLMKKHAKLVLRKKAGASKQNERPDNETEMQGNPLEMYSEVTRTLLGIIKHALSAKNIEGNSHLIYSLIYHQVDFLKVCTTKYNFTKKNGTTSTKKLYSSKQIARIRSVIAKTSKLIQDEGGRSAPRVLKVIESEMGAIKEAAAAADDEIASKRKKYNHSRPDGDDLDAYNSMNGNDVVPEEDFTFLYEEEADPEVFFVPYLWDIIVSVVTAGGMEWKKNDIKAFALLDEVDQQVLDQSAVTSDVPTTGNFSQNAEEMV